MEWFKFYGKDWLTDPKVKRLSTVHRLMYVYLLCHVSDNEKGQVEYLTEWDLITDCGITPNDDLIDQTRGFFEAVEKLGMITRDAHVITVNKYIERQQTHLTDAERSRRYRLNKAKVEQESDERHIDRVTNATLDKNRLDKNREEKREDPPTNPNNSIQALDDLTVIAGLQAKFPSVNVRAEIEKAKDWLEANGRRKKNYVAFARNWLRTATQDAKNKPSGMVYCPKCGKRILTAHQATHRCEASVSSFAQSLVKNMPTV